MFLSSSNLRSQRYDGFTRVGMLRKHSAHRSLRGGAFWNPLYLHLIHSIGRPVSATGANNGVNAQTRALRNVEGDLVSSLTRKNASDIRALPELFIALCVVGASPALHRTSTLSCYPPLLGVYRMTLPLISGLASTSPGSSTSPPH